MKKFMLAVWVLTAISISAVVYADLPSGSLTTAGVTSVEPLQSAFGTVVRAFLNGYAYEDIAASQTTQALGATGAVGDVLHNLVCTFSADPSVGVSIKDGSSAAIVLIPDPGAAGFTNSGTLDWISASGAWQVTTGTNTTCKAGGRFT